MPGGVALGFDVEFSAVQAGDDRIEAVFNVAKFPALKMPDEAVSAGHGCNEQSEAITLEGREERRFNWPDHIAILVPRHESLVCLGEFHRDADKVRVFG